MKLKCLRTKLSRLALVGFAVSTLAGQVQSQQQKSPGVQYTLADLGVLPGGSFSQATSINNRGLITGLSDVADGTLHAVIWRDGKIIDVSQHTPPGTNSGTFASNEFGQVLFQGELTLKDPNNENFCAYGTGLTCRAFLWQNGLLIPLPSLGGPNTGAGWINDRGEAVGFAETNLRDPKCAPGVSFNGTGPQVLDFKPVIWGPFPGQIRELQLLHGDTVGMAFGINDLDQVVGGSGSCDDVLLPGPAVTPHAVLWENGTVTSMGNLGGAVNTNAFGVATTAFSINNRGEAVGAAALPGNATSHAFIWSKKLHNMVDLGTVTGDVYSVALAINNKGDIVGPSMDADGNLSAYVRKGGADSEMIDLNQLVPADSFLFLLVAFSINDLGEIVGFGVDNNGDLHGFLARPGDPIPSRVDGGQGERDAAASSDDSTDKVPAKQRPVLSDRTREMILRHMHLAGFGSLPNNRH